MVIVACIAAAIVILVLGLLFFRANGRRDFPEAKSSTEDQKPRATGIN
jgi:hypothetical protein